MHGVPSDSARICEHIWGHWQAGTVIDDLPEALNPDLYTPDVRAFLEAGEFVSATRYIQALRVGEHLSLSTKVSAQTDRREARSAVS